MREYSPDRIGAKNPRDRRRRNLRPLWLLPIPTLVLLGQTTGISVPTPIPGGTPVAGLRYLRPAGFPVPLRNPLNALGDRLRTPGKERFILAGTYTQSNTTLSIQIAWEMPNKTRIDLTGSGASRTLVFNGSATGGKTGSADDDLLESLGDDRAESILYNYGQPNFAMRLLGTRFRVGSPATASTAAYTGPYYDILDANYTVYLRSDRPARQKLFVFDTHSGLLVETRYKVSRSTSTVDVATTYTPGAPVAGQAVPAAVVRKENGAPVFKISIASAQVTAAAADSFFNLP